MSQFRNSPYWTHLQSSESLAAKLDRERMEKSRQSSFASVGQIIAKRYGQQGQK